MWTRSRFSRFFVRFCFFSFFFLKFNFWIARRTLHRKIVIITWKLLYEGKWRNHYYHTSSSSRRIWRNRVIPTKLKSDLIAEFGAQLIFGPIPTKQILIGHDIPRLWKFLHFLSITLYFSLFFIFFFRKWQPLFVLNFSSKTLKINKYSIPPPSLSFFNLAVLFEMACAI